jgi:L-aminopeptidase/D-esterase-like protein
MRYLREQGVGYPTGSGVAVPIVPAAILYDLEMGSADAYPDAKMGYEAAQAAVATPVEQGTVGAGTGCRVGTLGGNALATKGGIGSASIRLQEQLVVAALFAVNCVGDVVEEDGTIIGGLRQPDSDAFAGTLNAMQAMPPPNSSHTVIGAVATNAVLTKEEANKVAQMAHDGLARAVRPAHTLYDGDTIFSLATGQVSADVNLVGAFAAEVTAQAIRAGVKHAVSLGGVLGISNKP